MRFRTGLMIFLQMVLAVGCDAQHKADIQLSPQGLSALGQMSLANHTPVYELSSKAGKLVPSGTLQLHVDETGETETVVPIWGYSQLSPVGSQPHLGWWQLGTDPPYFFVKMERPVSQLLPTAPSADDPLFPSLMAQACPLLGFDLAGRLTPLPHTVAGSTIDIHGFEGEYAQSARRNMTFLGRSCLDMEPLYESILAEDHEYASDGKGKCMQRVIAKLPEAQEMIQKTKLPFLIFCFDGANDQAWYFGEDYFLGHVGGDNSSLDLRQWSNSVEFTLYNVSQNFTVDVFYTTTGTYSGRAILPPESRSPLMILDPKIKGTMTFTVGDGRSDIAYQELEISINR